MIEIIYEVTDVLDSQVVGSITPRVGGVKNIIEHIVLCTDGLAYTCYSQSSWADGKKTVSAFYGFRLADGESDPLADTQPMQAVAI
jgi:hypothetical protein